MTRIEFFTGRSFFIHGIRSYPGVRNRAIPAQVFMRENVKKIKNNPTITFSTIKKTRNRAGFAGYAKDYQTSFPGEFL